jgi:glucans biosynthesis protein C
MKKRVYYLDLLRVFLTILVFFQHSTISFGASGGWYYVSKECIRGIPVGLLSILNGINQSFFMSLFFFISAYLMPYSFDRKGPKLFFIDRVKRLLVPLLVFIFILNPLLIHWIWSHWGGYGFGPMWFVFTLLVFELSYALYRILSSKPISIKWKRPTTLGILAFIITTGTIAFALRLFCPTGKNILWLQLGYFSLYIFMYALGIIANRNKWLDKLKVRNALPWFLIAVFIGIPSLIYVFYKYIDHVSLFSGGWNLQALFYAYWEPFMCIGICYFLLAYTKAHFNMPHPKLQILSADSYAFYIIHPFFVVGFTFLSESLPIPPLARLLFVLIIGIPCGFLFAHILRFLTGKKWI